MTKISVGKSLKSLVFNGCWIICWFLVRIQAGPPGCKAKEVPRAARDFASGLTPAKRLKFESRRAHQEAGLAQSVWDPSAQHCRYQRDSESNHNNHRKCGETKENLAEDGEDWLKEGE